MWREVTGKVVFSRRLERAFDCIFGIKNKNQEIWACTGLSVEHVWYVFLIDPFFDKM
jgi:hypothetical protein